MTWEGLSPPYSTIVADPPWHYDKVNPDKDREGYKQPGGTDYSSLTLDEIKALPVADLADPLGCRLFLWVTNRYLRHAWDVVEAWGFKPMDRTFVWCKPPRCTAPVTTEYVIVGKVGKPLPLPWHGTTWFQWPLQPIHSQKPDAFMDLVEQWTEEPRVELFSRRPRLGWDSWGYGYESGGG